ncbi:MAG: phage holin family protein [Desulfomonilia bacterium]|jgi:putative membrane protein|uniref:Phage holin family protein n=1 Tax=anaerobic digester metagenome TaxID=1263854 RepID=A0A485LWC8_9ZZZZ|nr:phage holin family protein [Pseudomonadota bacterium]HON39080.1 phage holin family protein [Deltaproteobacteria bacterium]HRS57447.1 phage holin family protein [Desulfomonilia bacterium]HPD22631.1 phage holin family protein [Deltaproteobacteria bacterium]HPX19012.1 phage holin family protein [Deltaproteobacteria bacterium]
MRILVNWFVMTLAILIAAYLLPGVSLRSAGAAVAAALVLGLVNAILRPLLIVLTLPLTILSLGLFIFVINALLVLLTSFIVPGFDVHSFGWALLFSLVFSLVSFMLHRIVPG